MFIASSSLVALLNSVVSPPPREKESCDSKLFCWTGPQGTAERVFDDALVSKCCFTGKTSQAHVDLEPMYGFLDRQVIV